MFVKAVVMCMYAFRRQLKRDIATSYTFLSRREVDDLVPDADPLYVIHLVTYGGVIVTTYHVKRDPMFFKHKEKLVPSGKGSSVVVGKQGKRLGQLSGI